MHDSKRVCFCVSVTWPCKHIPPAARATAITLLYEWPWPAEQPCTTRVTHSLANLPDAQPNSQWQVIRLGKRARQKLTRGSLTRHRGEDSVLRGWPWPDCGWRRVSASNFEWLCERSRRQTPGHRLGGRLDKTRAHQTCTAGRESNHDHVNYYYNKLTEKINRKMAVGGKTPGPADWLHDAISARGDTPVQQRKL